MTSIALLRLGRKFSACFDRGLLKWSKDRVLESIVQVNETDGGTTTAKNG